MYKITKQQLPELLARLSSEQKVYVPIKSGGRSSFQLWQTGIETDLETLKTDKSPKSFFFTENEVLYESQKNGAEISLQEGTLVNEDFILFGMRACDLQGIKILDTVFLTEPQDTFYQAKREHGILITLACNMPEETCFCKTFGIACEAPEGDISLWQIDEDIYWQSLTEKGIHLTELVTDLLQNTDQTDFQAVNQEQETIRQWLTRLPYHNLTLSEDNKKPLKALFESPVWDRLYPACLGCGTCTFVCPTCQCYDIRDFDTGHGIQKQRCWDSCMYSDFTLMAHGNPRTTGKERFRQRFMHKLVYHPDNHNGEYGCTGCGRCVIKCPVSLNIIKVMKELEVCEHV